MIPSSSCDSVVYSASLGGILTVLAMRNAGLNPLLMNPTGFPGGDITQTLACIQVKPEGDAPDLLPQALLDLLSRQFQSIDEHKLFIDPESWKQVLRVLIKALQIPALFHITPHAIQRHGDDIEMAYMDRQGAKTMKLKRVVDCSVRGDLSYRTDGLKPARQDSPKGCIHLSCTGLAMKSQITSVDITQLQDRQWLRKNVNAQWLDQPGLAFDAALESLSNLIQGAGGELQMVPMRPLVFPDPQTDSNHIIVNPWSSSIQNSEDILRAEWEMGAYVTGIL